MSLFKYFTPAGAHRFLSTLCLRLTPPDEFNDPFEMRPPMDFVTGNDIWLQENIERDLPKMLSEAFREKGFSADDRFFDLFAAHILGKASDKQVDRMIRLLPVHARAAFRHSLPETRENYKKQLNMMVDALPAFSDKIEAALHTALPKTLGALCMSRNGNHPLMWAHYASEHHGVVVEFDDKSPCFNRRRSTDDEFGYFRPVLYSAYRPPIHPYQTDDLFPVLALTKAVEWSYEDEMRMLWPLKMSDSVVDENIHLLAIPESAIVSITFGCRSDTRVPFEVRKRLEHLSGGASVRLRQAVLDKRRFALVYNDI